MSLSPELELRLCERARSSKASERDQAFRELFDALRTRVFTMCLHVTGGRAEAEDAIQECFLAVHQGLAGFRGDARLSTWVYRIAIRSALGVRARRARGQVPLERVDAVPSLASSPEDSAHARRELLKVCAALDDLSDEDRVVLSLFAVEGLGHADIAPILGVPPGTVWSRLHLARRRLRATLGIPVSEPLNP